jgi:hypothetical protein
MVILQVRSSTKEDYYDDPVPSDTQNLTAATSTPEVMNISERNEDENAPAKQAKPAYQRTISGGLQSPKSTEVPHHAILKRMKSKGESKSYQLGHRLSLKWSTGAGPRIGCVKDYPMQLVGTGNSKGRSRSSSSGGCSACGGGRAQGSAHQ